MTIDYPNGAARLYVAAQLGGSAVLERVLEQKKAAMEKVFFPARGPVRLRLSGAKQLISDFRKLSPAPDLLLDLMLRYVELGVDFTNAYGDIDGPFYTSLVGVYADVINRLATADDPKLTRRFLPRLEAAVHNSSRVGWGFSDSLSELYHEFLNHYEDSM